MKFWPLTCIDSFAVVPPLIITEGRGCNQVTKVKVKVKVKVK